MVRWHIAVHTHRVPAFFSTQLHTSSSSRTSSANAGRSVSAPSGRFLIGVLIHRATVYRGISKMRSTLSILQRSKPARRAVCLLVSEEAGYSIGATVFAMVLRISTTIGPIFDDMCPYTDTAGVRHCFLNHDANCTSSLTS